MGAIPLPLAPPAQGSPRAWTRLQRLNSSLAALDAELAVLLGEPGRMRAIWFDDAPDWYRGTDGKARRHLDDWQRR